MTPPPLPLEIYCRIIGHVTDNKDLSALALCCTAFRDDAQRKMFCHPSQISFDQKTAFFDTIIASPERLGPMVKSYTIRGLAYDQSLIELERNVTEAALHLMCNLTTLKIFDAACITMENLLDCSFQLDILVVGWNDHSDSTMDPFFFDFLRKQPRLRHLRLQAGRSMEPIRNHDFRDDLTCCPNLLSLGAREDLIDLFLAKHRRIQHLEWYGFVECEHGILTSAQLASLEHLLFGITSISKNFAILQRMTSLVFLDVVLAYLRDREISKQLAFLEHTPRLRFLILTNFTLEPAEKPTETETARTAFALCPALEHIDVAVSEHPRRPDTYDRFYIPDASGEMRRSVLQTRDLNAVDLWLDD